MEFPIIFAEDLLNLFIYWFIQKTTICFIPIVQVNKIFKLCIVIQI